MATFGLGVSERSRPTLKGPRRGTFSTNFSPRGLKLNIRPEESFSQHLFNDEKSIIIREEAKKTEFITGMVNGTLNPDIYGRYMVQDAAYCFSAVGAFDCAAQKMQEQGKSEFSLLYRVESESYKSYNREFVDTWRVKNAESVVMGPAAEMYVGYESALSRQDPTFLCIAMLPCTMLWPWIADKLIDSVKEENPYYGWFENNMTDDKSLLEKFVDHFFMFCTPKDKERSLSIFHEGLVNELNFFRDACGETLYYKDCFL